MELRFAGCLMFAVAWLACRGGLARRWSLFGTWEREMVEAVDMEKSLEGHPCDEREQVIEGEWVEGMGKGLGSGDAGEGGVYSESKRARRILTRRMRRRWRMRWRKRRNARAGACEPGVHFSSIKWGVEWLQCMSSVKLSSCPLAPFWCCSSSSSPTPPPPRALPRRAARSSTRRARGTRPRARTGRTTPGAPAPGAHLALSQQQGGSGRQWACGRICARWRTAQQARVRQHLAQGTVKRDVHSSACLLAGPFTFLLCKRA